MTIDVSIIIPALNEEKYIENCLDSIASSDYELSKIEVIVVDGMSSDNTVNIVKNYSNLDNISLIINKRKITPVAFNLGITASKGKYVLVLSSHSSISRNYISGLVKSIEKLDCDLVGGTFNVLSQTDNIQTRSIKAVLSSKWGAGNSKSRVGVTKPERADTASGLYRRDVFERVGMFDERLARNQDMELSKRISRAGGKIYVIPDVSYSYYCRESLKDFFKQGFRSGYWIMNTSLLIGFKESHSLRHFIPLFFCLYIFLSPVGVFLGLNIIILYLPLLIYFVILASEIHRNKGGMTMLLTFFGYHISYGLGSLRRLLMKGLFQ